MAMKEDRTYKIRKTLIEKNVSTILNDPLGVVAEFTFDEAIRICQLLNANTDSNCRYEIEFHKPKQNKDFTN